MKHSTHRYAHQWALLSSSAQSVVVVREQRLPYLVLQGYKCTHKQTNFDYFPWQNCQWRSATKRQNLYAVLESQKVENRCSRADDTTQMSEFISTTRFSQWLPN